MRQKIAAIIVVLTTVTLLVGCASQQELAFRSIQGKTHSAITPMSRAGEWWAGRHDAINEQLKKGNVGLLFVGDSITQGWENVGKEIWAKYYAPNNAVNMGISGDRTQHVLWRLDHSNFENVSPELAVVLIGVNNSRDNTAEEIAEGTIAICQRLRTKLPKMKILLLAILPTKSESRNQKHATASLLASRTADGKMIHYLDINPHFLTDEQELIEGVMRDGVHPNENGYRIWAEAIESKVTELIGDAIIYFAASRGDVAKIEALVRKGIDVNAADAQGCTALHYAAQEGHKEVVELLLSKGANINAKNNDRKTPLEVAASQRRKDVVKLLVEKGAEIPTIHLAAFVGSLDKLRSFRKAGTDINAKDARGMTPLLRAVTGRHVDAVKFLIDNGADVNTGDEQGYVSLMYALWTMDSDMVKLLVDKRADVNAKDTQSGYTSLHWAVMAGSKELAELILEGGADLNAESTRGETPLDLARQGGPEIVQLLRKHGAKETSRATLRRRQSGPEIQVPDGVRLETDIAYREGNEKWRLDLAYPEAKSKSRHPGLVIVHGGGWRGGDKAGPQWRSIPLQYAAKGYVCISVNYRLTDEAPFPACVEDVKCAVRWLRAHADRYGLDPSRIGAYGNSAGAHLVAMLGLAGPDAGLEGDGPYQEQSSLVQAVCCSATPTDFSSWGGSSELPPAASSLLAGPSETLADRKKQASPISYVGADAPPFLIIHGTADRTVPFSQGERFAAALKKVGAKDVTFLKFEDTGHGVFGQHSDETYPAMERFFARTLRR
ncbi:MAG: ankyrin repeat domain-containing protein [Planctomycetota bacterium]